MLLFPILFSQCLGLRMAAQDLVAPMLLESSTNPLDRDEDLIPDSIDDSGDDYSSGDTYFLLVTTFIESNPGAGKLWVVPIDPDMREFSYELITGLDRPTGVCFDVNHNFLYVVDNGFEETGHIYQYEIDWYEDETFVLSRNVYVIIYSGLKPFDCKIDEYGNMYFLEASYDSINMISYLDLYSGFTNMNYTIYSSDPFVSYPVSLEVVGSEDIYFANHYNGDEVGSVNRADASTEFVNGGEVDVLVKNKYRTWGLAHTAEDLVFFTLETGEVWTVDDNDPNDLQLKSQDFLEQPRGMCYGDGYVYLAEYDVGNVWRFRDNRKEETPDMFIGLEGAYAVFCVNSGVLLTAAISAYFI